MEQTDELHLDVLGPHVKKRRWHPVVRWLVRIALLLLVAILSAGIWVWVWVTREPVISCNYVQELNTPVLAADPTTLAWPEIKRSLIALPDEPDPLWEMTWKLNKDWMETRPDDPMWPAARDYLVKSQPMLQGLRDAVKRPSLGFLLTDGDDPELSADYARRHKVAPTTPDSPSTPNPRLLDTKLPYIGKFRFATRLLRADTRLALEQGDTDRVLANLRATFGLSRLAPQRGGLIGYMVSIAIDNVVLGVVAECLEVRGDVFTEPLLQEMRHIVESSTHKQSLDAALESDRQTFEDYLQRTFADDGRGNGGVTPAGVRELRDAPRGDNSAKASAWETTFAYLCGMFVVADRKEQLVRFDQIIASARADGKVPAWEFDGLSAATNSLTKPKPVFESIKYAPALLFYPSLTKVIEHDAGAIEHRDATLAIIAIHRYRILHGRWPDSLADLIPDLIAAEPTDRFTGDPLIYQLGSIPLLYSVGINRVDDGGRPASHHQYASEWMPPTLLAASKRKLNWDHIFFPPSRVNEPKPPENSPQPTTPATSVE